MRAYGRLGKEEREGRERGGKGCGRGGVEDEGQSNEEKEAAEFSGGYGDDRG